MKVIQVAQFGGPEVLTVSESPDPAAGPGQVVVGVSAVDTLFVETQIRSGWGKEYFAPTLPYVPGGGVAGRVISVGAGVDAGWIGRAVAASTGTYGGYAEQVAVPVEALIPVPDGLGPREAAALVTDGVTALAVLDGAQLNPGEWVLVTAAAGGFGSLLVQLAHAAEAHVIGAARGERKLARVRDLGADVVVDYSEPGWSDQVSEVTGGRGADVVLDGAGGEIGRAAFEVTARGGRFSAHGAPSGGFAAVDPAEAERRDITVRGIQHVQLAPEDRRRLAARALAEAAAGRLRPSIGQTFPLTQAADAHAAIESRRVVGKTLLLV